MDELHDTAPVGPAEDPHRYLLERKLAAGGEGQVWMARSRSGAIVAIKVLDSRHLGDIDVWEQRWQRGLTLPECVADSAIRIHEVFRGSVETPTGPRATLLQVMEYADGVSFEDWLTAGDKPLAARYDMLARITIVVRQLHEAETPVLHRDIKPDNIIITAEGPKLIDLGFTRRLDTEHSMTKVGSMPFLAPETLSGVGYSPASDTYALGVTAFEALTGQNFPAARPDRARATLDDVPGVDQATADLVLSMTAADPERRPTDLSEVTAHFATASVVSSHTTKIISVPTLVEHTSPVARASARDRLRPAVTAPTVGRAPRSGGRRRRRAAQRRAPVFAAAFASIAVAVAAVGLAVGSFGLNSNTPGFGPELAQASVIMIEPDAADAPQDTAEAEPPPQVVEQSEADSDAAPAGPEPLEVPRTVDSLVDDTPLDADDSAAEPADTDDATAANAPVVDNPPAPVRPQRNAPAAPEPAPAATNPAPLPQVAPTQAAALPAPGEPVVVPPPAPAPDAPAPQLQPLPQPPQTPPGDGANNDGGGNNDNNDGGNDNDGRGDGGNNDGGNNDGGNDNDGRNNNDNDGRGDNNDNDNNNDGGGGNNGGRGR